VVRRISKGNKKRTPQKEKRQSVGKGKRKRLGKNTTNPQALAEDVLVKRQRGKTGRK